MCYNVHLLVARNAIRLPLCLCPGNQDIVEVEYRTPSPLPYAEVSGCGSPSGNPAMNGETDMFDTTIQAIVHKHLDRKLDAGHHELVFGLSQYWGANNGLGKLRGFSWASADVQDRLVSEFGYKRCPYCTWAKSGVVSHEYCDEQILEKFERM